jgi:tyrosyl-tRNA synthetase
MGGDLNKIRTVGSYMIEIWKALGMNVNGVKFLWASEEVEKRGDEYWSLVMDINQKRSFKRIVRYTY